MYIPMWIKYTLILLRRVSGLQSDTPLAVSQRDAVWFHNFVATEASLPICGHQVVRREIQAMSVPFCNKLQLYLEILSGCVSLILESWVELSFPLSTSGEYLCCSLNHTILFGLSVQQPYLASLYVARMDLSHSCLLLIFDTLVFCKG